MSQYRTINTGVRRTYTHIREIQTEVPKPATRCHRRTYTNKFIAQGSIPKRTKNERILNFNMDRMDRQAYESHVRHTIDKMRIQIKQRQRRYTRTK